MRFSAAVKGKVKPTATGKLTSAKAGGKSARKTPTFYVDVGTESAYTAAGNTVAKFDEIGVLPPIGRWDPLNIRAQVRAAPTIAAWALS